MRWIIRTVAVLSVVSWIVVEGLFASLSVPAPAQPMPAIQAAERAPKIPVDWPRRLAGNTRVLFPGASSSDTASVLPIVQKHAGRFQLDPMLVLAVIQVESRFDPRAVSGQGAMGLMQLQSATARELAGDLGLEWTGDDLLFDADTNVLLGCAYLRQLLDRFGNRDAALAAYESGPAYIEARRDAGKIPMAYSDRVWDVLSTLHLKMSSAS